MRGVRLVRRMHKQLRNPVSGWQGARGDSTSDPPPSASVDARLGHCVREIARGLAEGLAKSHQPRPHCARCAHDAHTTRDDHNDAVHVLRFSSRTPSIQARNAATGTPGHSHSVPLPPRLLDSHGPHAAPGHMPASVFSSATRTHAPDVQAAPARELPLSGSMRCAAPPGDASSCSRHGRHAPRAAAVQHLLPSACGASPLDKATCQQGHGASHSAPFSSAPESVLCCITSVYGTSTVFSAWRQPGCMDRWCDACLVFA